MSDEEYVVESIIASKIVKGREQFLVKWKGYSEDESTWEPEQNLENAHDALAVFRAKKRKRKDEKADGNWEEQVVKVETMERTSDGQLLVKLCWKNDETSVHPSELCRRNCPQKVLY